MCSPRASGMINGLLTSPNLIPFTKATNHQVEHVSDLLTASGKWNEELIREIFCTFDADAILLTPVNGHGEDFWAWATEKHGVYSVKSAYRLLEANQKQVVEDEASGSSSCHDWQTLWKLEVPPKVRVFWWRVLHGFLPTRHVLHRRHIEKDTSCEVCGTRYETIKHILMDCTLARLFWEDARTITGVKLPRLHERTWARDLLQPDICLRKNAAVILCGMWSLWMMRNKRRHGEVVKHLNGYVIHQLIFDIYFILRSLKSQGRCKDGRHRLGSGISAMLMAHFLHRVTLDLLVQSCEILMAASWQDVRHDTI
jgi:hypothetical protein